MKPLKTNDKENKGKPELKGIQILTKEELNNLQPKMNGPNNFHTVSLC
jgi:hypothetical protein